jgi:hypothetical protein
MDGRNQLAELAREDYEANLSAASSHLEYQVQFAQSLLKNLTLVNGGAIVAILTFIGNTKAQFDTGELWNAIAAFSGGLGSVLLSYLSAHACQSYFHGFHMGAAWKAQTDAKGMIRENENQNDLRIGNRYLHVANFFSVLSLACFVLGSALGISALS